MKDEKQAEIDKRKQIAKERQEKLAEKKRLEDAAKKVCESIGGRLCMADLAVIAVLGEEATTNEETSKPVEAGEGVIPRCGQCTERVVVRSWERFTTAMQCVA